MNFEYFLARRIASSKQKSFTAFIIRIAIIAIALSITVMIVATALVSGFKNEISRKVFGFWGHIHIQDFRTNQSFESFPITKFQDFYPDLADIGQLQYDKPIKLLGRELDFSYNTKTKGGIRHIQAFANKAGIIKSKSQLEGIVLKGIDKDYDWEFLKDFLVEGDELVLPDTMSNHIIISETTSQRLKISLEDNFRVYFVENGRQLIRSFVVSGIYKTGIEEYDKKFALVDIRQIQRLNKWEKDEVSGFEVFLDDINDLDVFGDYIYENAIGPSLYSNTLKQIYPNLFGWLDLQDINETVIRFLMILVAILNMTTALIILILERTNMVGVLKSLGATNWTVRKVFLYHAAYIILIGMAIGNAVGIGLCLLQQKFQFITLPEESYYVSVAPVDLSFGPILWVNLLTLGCTLLVLLVPSYLITNISPVKAIRFK